MIVALNAILSDMIEIQDLNEIIDRVRGLLDQQSKILDRSKEQQKKSTLDLLK
jgi:parvulin-like peptidyl-prolyl isomerase